MPELPEVETVRRGLQPYLEGAVIARVELRRADLRFPFPADFVARIEKQKVTALSRRAKYLLAELANGMTLVMHLGMSGSFRIEAAAKRALPTLYHQGEDRLTRHDHVIFHLAGEKGEGAVIYNDPRRFGFMDVIVTAEREAHPLFRHLGVEPLGNRLSAETLALRLKGRKTPLKAALLDQRLIAGLGNIYVCEALHGAGLSPRRAAGSLVRANGEPTARLKRLTGHIREVIAQAIAAGGSSLRDHRQTDGSLGYFQHQFAVYDQTGRPCPKPGCSGTIRRIAQSGRSTFYCPACQR